MPPCLRSFPPGCFTHYPWMTKIGWPKWTASQGQFVSERFKQVSSCETTTEVLYLSPKNLGCHKGEVKPNITCVVCLGGISCEMFSSLSERTINNFRVCGTPIASSAWMRSSPTKKDHLTASVSFRELYPTPKNLLQNIKYQPYHHPSHQTSTKHPHHHPSPIIWYDVFVENHPLDSLTALISRSVQSRVNKGSVKKPAKRSKASQGSVEIGRFLWAWFEQVEGGGRFFCIVIMIFLKDF